MNLQNMQSDQNMVYSKTIPSNQSEGNYFSSNRIDQHHKTPVISPKYWTKHHIPSNQSEGDFLPTESIPYHKTPVISPTVVSYCSSGHPLSTNHPVK